MSRVRVTKQNPRGRPQRRSPAGPALAIAGGLILLAAAAFALWRGQGGRASAAFTPEVTGAARVKVDKERVDLGDVKLGETVKVSFQITNAGDQALRFAEAPYVEVVEGC